MRRREESKKHEDELGKQNPNQTKNTRIRLVMPFILLSLSLSLSLNVKRMVLNIKHKFVFSIYLSFKV